MAIPSSSRKSDSASTGEIVVALVDNEEATLKRLRRRGDSIAPEAANPAYETRLYGADRVKVQGKLVGLDPAIRGAAPACARRARRSNRST